MFSRFLTTAAAAAFLLGAVAVPTYTHAEMLKKEEPKKDETKKAKAKKEPTPQQLKMKDCSVKWGEEKKAKNVKGKKAHNEFMSNCLKKS
jgi:predicted membrane protein